MARQIPLSKGLVAVVDDEDYERLSTMRWHASGCSRGYYYATCKNKGSPFAMHRNIIEQMHGPIPKGMEVDHVNGDTLDNRRSNLRLATPAQNRANHRVMSNSRSGLIGVRFITRSKVHPWLAYISDGTGRCKHLGCFATKEEAASAYAAAAREKYGEFASREAQSTP